MSQLHKLKLHEKIREKGKYSANFEITRVPGGWIYRFFEWHQETGSDGQLNENCVADSIFVPFSNEFNINKIGE